MCAYVASVRSPRDPGTGARNSCFSPELELELAEGTSFSNLHGTEIHQGTNYQPHGHHSWQVRSDAVRAACWLGGADLPVSPLRVETAGNHPVFGERRNKASDRVARLGDPNLGSPADGPGVG